MKEANLYIKEKDSFVKYKFGIKYYFKNRFIYGIIKTNYKKI